MTAREDGQPALPEAFWLVTRQLRRATARALAPWDVTPSHSRALGTLARHGPMRLGALSEHLGIAPRSATELADALTGRGLAERLPDPADRRAVLLALTDEGHRLTAAVRAARESETAAFFAALEPDDLAHLHRILLRLLDEQT